MRLNRIRFEIVVNKWIQVCVLKSRSWMRIGIELVRTISWLISTWLIASRHNVRTRQTRSGSELVVTNSYSSSWARSDSNRDSVHTPSRVQVHGPSWCKFLQTNRFRYSQRIEIVLRSSSALRNGESSNSHPANSLAADMAENMKDFIVRMNCSVDPASYS